MKEVFVFTAGYCVKNPGDGGYGAILKYRDSSKELLQGYQHTTTNRMEMMAVIAALEVLRESCIIHITTASKYVNNGCTTWIQGWKKNGWKTYDGLPIKNTDLWQKLDELISRHDVTWHLIDDTSSTEESKRCNALAISAATGKSGPLLSNGSFINLGGWLDNHPQNILCYL